MADVSENMKGLSSAIAGAVSGITSAISQVVGVVQGLISQMLAFVAPLDPAFIKVFDQTMRDLNATIGKGFIPILHAVMDAARLFADTLTPLMEQVKPIMQRMAVLVGQYATTAAAQFSAAFAAFEPLYTILASVVEILGGLFFSGMNAVAVVLKLLTPVISLLAAAITVCIAPFQMAATIIEVFAKTLSVMASGMAQLFNIGDAVGGFKAMISDIINGFKSLVGVVARTAIMLAGWLAKMAGMTSYIDGMIRGLESGKKDGSSVGAAAPQQAAITDFSSFGKSVATSAFTATANGGESESQLDILKGMAEELRKLKMEPLALKDIIVSALNEAGKATGSGIADLPRKAYNGANWVLDTALEKVVGSVLWATGNTRN